MKDLLTIGQIARQLRVPRTRLDYAIDKADIRERERAGILRLFARDQIPDMEAALATVQPRGGQDTNDEVEQGTRSGSSDRATCERTRSRSVEEENDDED